MNFSLLISKLQEREDLRLEEMSFAMKQIMAGQVGEEEMISFLTALRDKGEVKDEIVGAAQVMREFSVKVNVHPDNLVDTCGTGGDNLGTFNLSTAAAFVVAGAGVRVAKHGNRAVSSKSGSADVLEALGIKIDLEPVQVRKCLIESGFGFFFAPRFHPAMKNVAGARKKIGTRTIFNLLGPLTNPASPVCQVIGVYDQKKMVLLAEVLKDLGSRHVWLVHGEDGLDEVTLTGKTKVVVLKDGAISELELNPESLGFVKVAPEVLKGKDAAYNAFLLKGIMEGFESPLRDAVLLNAAVAFVAAGRAMSVEEGIAIGEHSLDQGHAYQVMKDVIRISNE